MRDNDARCPICDGISEDFSWVDEAAGECADGNDAPGNEPVGTVERQADEVFLLFVAYIAELIDSFFG